MASQPNDSSATRHLPREVRIVWLLVALTVAFSLVFALQYYLGGPVRLAVISEMRSVAVSPDRTLIATGAEDGLLRLFEVPAEFSSRIPEGLDISQVVPWTRHVLSGHSAPVLAVSFTPDSQNLVSAAQDGEVLLWDVASRQMHRSLKVSGGPLVALSLNPDGSALASVGEDGVIRIWDLVAGEETRVITAGGDKALAVALSRDRSLVAAGNGSHILLWNAQTGQFLREFAGQCEDETLATQDDCEKADKGWLGHDDEVTALAISPAGDLLVSGSADTTVVFWQIEHGTVAWSSEGHWGPVESLAFNPEGDLVLSTGKDNVLKTLKTPGGKSSGTYAGHLATVNGAVNGPLPDTLVSVSDDGTMRVWEMANQYDIHMEWSRFGLQPTWGASLSGWMLFSGLLGLVVLWGLRRVRLWSHLAALALFLLGPLVVVGLPLFEVASYPLGTAVKLQVAAPLIGLAVWYGALLVLLTREPVAQFYEAPRVARLAEQLQISQRTLKLRFGVYGAAVWIFLLVLLFSVLRRFHLDVAFMGHYFQFIMGGATITLYISAASIALAVVLALLGALGRLSRNPIANGASSFYISLIRGTPLLVQIFVWYLGLPQLGIKLEAELAGILALGVNYGAYMTEVFRAGIQAIGKGQHEAAHALGMSRAQTFRRIVLPQAFRIVIPPIGNEFIAMMKDSSLVYVMGVWELTFRANKVGRQNFRAMETFLIAAAFYWILTMVFQFLQGKLEERMARGERR